MTYGECLPAGVKGPSGSVPCRRRSHCRHLRALCTYRLTFSQELGDALSWHAQKDPGEADLCLGLWAGQEDRTEHVQERPHPQRR